MPTFLSKLTTSFRKLSKTVDSWGRIVDRDVWTGKQPDSNPDPIDAYSTGERYFRVANNPYVKAGLNFRDISRLFVSAKGLDPDDTGAYFPAQLIYTTEGIEEQRLALAEQYDELFVGGPPGQQGFNAILASLQQPAMQYGRAIGEIDWYKDSDGSLKASYIWSRDPEEYILFPPNLPPGIYKKNHIYSTAFTGGLTRMDDGKFMVITYDPLYNNPYGQSVLRPIADLTETWDKVYESWRMGLIRAGYGWILGEYGPEIAGEGTDAKLARAQYLEEIGKLANGTHGIFDARNNIRTEKVQLDAQAFLDFHTAYVQAVSVLMTGSATALSEGKYGSYSSEEATSVREKSDKEQTDALLMGSAFTYQFNQIWMIYNYGVDAVVPQLQLIRPELIMPTTPEGQGTQDDIEQETIAIQTEENEPAELQEGEEEGEGIEPSYTTFPDTEPEPDIYLESTVEDAARTYIQDMPNKNYKDVSQNDAANVFTVKRLRNFEDAVNIQSRLKDEIEKTIGLPTEAEAWEQYIQAAKSIFAAQGIDLGRGLESDLIISFRQARQSAYQAGIDTLIEENPEGLTGIEYITKDDGRVRPVHALWNGVVLAPDDERIERIKPPGDFGCRCRMQPVYNNDKPLTPENEIPDIYPGESYRGYV